MWAIWGRLGAWALGDRSGMLKKGVKRGRVRNAVEWRESGTGPECC